MAATRDKFQIFCRTVMCDFKQSIRYFSFPVPTRKVKCSLCSFYIYQIAAAWIGTTCYSKFVSQWVQFQFKISNHPHSTNKKERQFRKNVYKWFCITLKYYPICNKKMEVKTGPLEMKEADICVLQLDENSIFSLVFRCCSRIPLWNFFCEAWIRME